MKESLIAPSSPLSRSPAAYMPLSREGVRCLIGIHFAFFVMLGIFISTVQLDLNDGFPVPISIQIDSFSVSSLNLNISRTPERPSSVTAKWNVSFTGRNDNFRSTNLLEDVKVVVLYREVFVSGGDATLLSVPPKQCRSSWVGLGGTMYVEDWVVRNIAADKLRDDTVTFNLSVKAIDVWSSKRKYSLSYRCDELKVVFNDAHGYGTVSGTPTDCYLKW